MKTTITFNTSLLAYLFLSNISILNILNVSIKTYMKKCYVKIVYLKMNKTYIYIYEEKSLKYQCMACICFPLNLLFNIHYLYI